MSLKTLFWIGGIGALLIGSIGVVDRLSTGHVHANYGSIVTWGLWVALYIYFIGLSAGSFLISSLVYVFGVKKFKGIGRLSVFTAIVTLLCALLAIWFDLGHLDRAWHVMAYPNFHSPMAWMIFLYSTYMLLLFVEFWVLMRRDLVAGKKLGGLRGFACRVLALWSTDTSEASSRRDLKIVKVLATAGVPLAICFHCGVGALFGVVAARPYWHSGMFPILFLLGALVSGGALLILASAVFQEAIKAHGETIVALGRLVFALLLLDVLFQMSEMLVTFYGGMPGHIAGYETMIGGPLAWVFWVFQFGIGMIVPVTILASPLHRNPRWVAGAALAMVLGFLAVRLIIVIPGLSMEEVYGLTHAIYSPRITTWYLPSVMEWLVTFAITGFGLVLFGLGEIFLPLSHHLDVPKGAPHE